MNTLDSPLLEKKPKEWAASRITAHRLLWCTCIGTFALYIFLGTVERLAFAQMVHVMPTGVLLMHTLLSLMTLLLFIVLQLARSQGESESENSETLQRMNALEVLQMGALDALHSLLSLEGASAISGVSQVLLLQVRDAQTTRHMHERMQLHTCTRDLPWWIFKRRGADVAGERADRHAVELATATATRGPGQSRDAPAPVTPQGSLLYQPPIASRVRATCHQLTCHLSRPRRCADRDGDRGGGECATG